MASRPQLSRGKTWILIGLIAFFVLWYYAGPYTRRSSTQGLGPPDFAIDATALMHDYETNEVAADLKYRGKVVLIDGIVRKTGKDITDTIYVAYEVENPITTVQCFFTNKFARKIAALRPGQEVKIKGKVERKLINVLVQDCTIVD